jgi:transposase-like protein
MSSIPEQAAKALPMIQVDQELIHKHLDQVVRDSVEQTRNALLEAEADELCGAQRYERSPERLDTRAGHYTRPLHTKAGAVTLQVPKLRNLPFETAIIERYRRRETSVEEALVEMDLAGVSTRRVEDITAALWGTRVSSSTVSDLNKKMYAHIEQWRNRPLEGRHPYVYWDGIWLKRCWGGEVRNSAVLVAVGVNHEGFREVLGVLEGTKEDKESWVAFLRSLKGRGLPGVRLFLSDKCLGLVESLAEFYPEACWQRCAVPFYRNVFTAVPKGKVKEVAAMRKAIHAQEDTASAQEKARQVAQKLEALPLGKAAALIRAGIDETLTSMAFPREHWRSLRTNNLLERLMRALRRRTRVVGCFPDGESAVMLVGARRRHVAGTKWGRRRYLDRGHWQDWHGEMIELTELTIRPAGPKEPPRSPWRERRRRRVGGSGRWRQEKSGDSPSGRRVRGARRPPCRRFRRVVRRPGGTHCRPPGPPG